MSKKFYRQGDVILIPVEEKDKPHFSNMRMSHNNILARGEVTGHKHKIDEGDAALYEDLSGEKFLNVKSDEAALNHEEHGRIGIRKGTYRVLIQREYDEQQDRKVID